MKRILTGLTALIAGTLMLTACSKCSQEKPAEPPPAMEPAPGTPPADGTTPPPVEGAPAPGTETPPPPPSGN